MLERDYAKHPAFTPEPERSNDVILAVTRAQYDALRWINSRRLRATLDTPGSRVRDTLRARGLATSHYNPRSYHDRYELTAAGRAVLRALVLLARPKKKGKR